MSDYETRWDRDAREMMPVLFQYYTSNRMYKGPKSVIEEATRYADMMEQERKNREETTKTNNKTTGNANDLHELSKMLDEQDDYIQQLEEENRELSQRLADARERIADLERENDELVDDLNRETEESIRLRKELDRAYFQHIAESHREF